MTEHNYKAALYNPTKRSSTLFKAMIQQAEQEIG